MQCNQESSLLPNEISPNRSDSLKLALLPSCQSFAPPAASSTANMGIKICEPCGLEYQLDSPNLYEPMIWEPVFLSLAIPPLKFAEPNLRALDSN